MPDIPILDRTIPDGPQINVTVTTRGVQPPPGVTELGRVLVAVTLGIGLVEATFVMPVATAEILGPLVNTELAKAAAQVRRVLSGVILPSDLPSDQAAQLFNGGHPHDPRGPR